MPVLPDLSKYVDIAGPHVRMGRRQVRIPIAAILAALPDAARAARERAADDHAESSPGGANVTAGEVAEDVAAFLSVLAEAVLPAVLKANGL